MSMAPAIVWLRQDLRLADNPALLAGAARGGPVIPVYIWAPDEEGGWAPGAASRWWLHRSLADLDGSLRRHGSRLLIRRGPSLDALRDLAAATGAEAIFWSRRYEPAAARRDEAVRQALTADGLCVETFNSALLIEPREISTSTGGPYRVFTPFWRALTGAGDPPPPLAAPRALTPPSRWPDSLDLDSLRLMPAVDWTDGLRSTWTPGETAAAARLRRFKGRPVAAYGTDRDRPDRPGTSSLSPHLHFGEIGPRQMWHAVRAAPPAARGAWRRQIAWREFTHHLLHHFPHTPERPLRDEFAAFPWRDDPAALRAWQRGRTGYPMVDAGMRELWTTGWMHNRVRMIAASFLVKDLLLPWQAGAAWFWDTLVDADLANNTFGWQWVAGCGADAAPYFRIFNPVLQGERFDPRGDYVRRFVSELRRAPAGRIHRPWDGRDKPAGGARTGGGAGRAGAAAPGGGAYPAPIVDHAERRARALELYGALRAAGSRR